MAKLDMSTSTSNGLSMLHVVVTHIAKSDCWVISHPDLDI